MHLHHGGILMYEKVPMVEMDGMNLVETRAILRYIAAKYDLYGRSPKEQAWIDMYAEGLKDLSDMAMFLPLSLPREKEMNLEYILERATTRFFPIYEKMNTLRSSERSGTYLNSHSELGAKIGNQVSEFLEAFLPNHVDFNLEDPKSSSFVFDYPQALRDHGQDFLVGDQLNWVDVQLLEVILMAEEWKPNVLSGFPLLQEFKARISSIPTINKFLQPGSQRKPPLDEDSTEVVKNIFKFEHGMFLKNMGTIIAEY